MFTITNDSLWNPQNNERVKLDKHIYTQIRFSCAKWCHRKHPSVVTRATEDRVVGVGRQGNKLSTGMQLTNQK